LINKPGSSFSGQDIFLGSTTRVAIFFYIITSFIQEFICRGFVQNNVERILIGKYKSLFAVLTTSMLFGVVHMHYSGTAIFITVFAGMFFGLLYLRHRTLVGIAVSHFILGQLVFELGFFG
jgi:membrane protease YdiL (CAAX protease family)